jgi:hypothetical protein
MAASGLRGEQSWTRAAIKAEEVTVGQNDMHFTSVIYVDKF